MTPVSLAGVALSYRNGTATPTNFVFNRGRFGDGHIATFDRNTVLKLGPITQLSLQAFDTVWYADAGYRNIQWLERLALTRNISRDSSFAVGLRRIIGTPPAVGNFASYGVTPFPVGPASFSSATNVSVAYAYHRKRDELYLRLRRRERGHHEARAHPEVRVLFGRREGDVTKKDRLDEAVFCCCGAPVARSRARRFT